MPKTNEKHSQEAADFKDKFEEQSSELLSAQNTISERDDTIKNLGTEIDALKKTLSANEKHSQEAADFKDKFEEQSSELLSAQNTISERDDTIKNLGTEIDALKKTLSANEKHSQEAADFKDKLKVALEDKKTYNQKLNVTLLSIKTYQKSWRIKTRCWLRSTIT